MKLQSDEPDRITDLSIIVPSFRTPDRLAACLAAVAKAYESAPDLVCETIVVDNGSADSSLEIARASEVGARVVAFVRNRGFAAAINAGLSIRRGRHVLLLNSDAFVASDALRRGVALLDQHPSIGIASATLKHEDGRAQRSGHFLPSLATELAPAGLHPLVCPGRPTPLDRLAQADPGETIRPVEAARGAVLFIRGSVVDQVGPLDERYFFFLEDTDYCERALAAGYSVVEVRTIEASHQLGASSKDRAPLATRIEFHRSLYRYFEGRHGVMKTRCLRTIKAIAAFVGLVLGLPACLRASGRARWRRRLGVGLWHLRGCPDEPSLERALRPWE